VNNTKNYLYAEVAVLHAVLFHGIKCLDTIAKVTPKVSKARRAAAIRGLIDQGVIDLDENMDVVMLDYPAAMQVFIQWDAGCT